MKIPSHGHSRRNPTLQPQAVHVAVPPDTKRFAGIAHVPRIQIVGNRAADKFGA